MFNRVKFYEQAHAGGRVQKEELIRYISSFKNIILWGGKFRKFSWRKITGVWD